LRALNQTILPQINPSEKKTWWDLLPSNDRVTFQDLVKNAQEKEREAWRTYMKKYTSEFELIEEV
jgi:TRAP-type C4-dicarboxylate transport system substrate-binding protein